MCIFIGMRPPDSYKPWIAGQEHGGHDAVVIKNPYTQAAVAEVFRAGPEDVEFALSQAHEAFQRFRATSVQERFEMLSRLAKLVEQHQEDFARTITAEAGKPVKTARGEVARAIMTFSLAAEEARRIHGEVIPLDLASANKGRVGITRRFPLGVVTGITPFNFPLNLVAHKVGPALAAGNTINLKPSSFTPVTALKLARLASEAGVPPGVFNVLPCAPEMAEPLVTDPRVKKITFTGSPDVGWKLKERCGQKRITLELGGNAAVVLEPDVDVAHAAERCTVGGFAYSGQVCISVQRIYVHEKIEKAFMERFLDRVGKLASGDPMHEQTDVGPMITEKEAERVEAWVDRAVRRGAQILIGGRRRGAFYEPTVMTNVPSDCEISCKEVFGPLVVVEPYQNFGDALARVNDSPYGLQAGVFTNDLSKVWRAFEALEVGGVIINDVPTFRSDNMPYGGVKGSGLGREGVRYAVEEMTEIKLLALNPVESKQG